jgi:hypothetical protein
MTDRERLRRAADLYRRRGDVGGARPELEAALGEARRMRAPSTHQPYLLPDGRFAKGASYLRRCLDRDEANNGVRAEFARALAALGDFDGAAAAEDLARNSGYILQTRSQPEEPALCYDRVVVHQPDDFEAFGLRSSTGCSRTPGSTSPSAIPPTWC